MAKLKRLSCIGRWVACSILRWSAPQPAQALKACTENQSMPGSRTIIPAAWVGYPLGHFWRTKRRNRWRGRRSRWSWRATCRLHRHYGCGDAVCRVGLQNVANLSPGHALPVWSLSPFPNAPATKIRPGCLRARLSIKRAAAEVLERQKCLLISRAHQSQQETVVPEWTSYVCGE